MSTHLMQPVPDSATTGNSVEDERMTLINYELEAIFEATQEYLLKNMIAEDLDIEMKNAIRKAANELAYRKELDGATAERVVPFPTCKTLIKNCDLIVEAEKFFYSGKEAIPDEYSEAVTAAVSVLESREADRSTRKVFIKNMNFLDDDTDETEDESDDDESSLIDKEHNLSSTMVENVGGSWRDSFDEVLDYRMSLA
jgi:hypothetical protein